MGLSGKIGTALGIFLGVAPVVVTVKAIPEFRHALNRTPSTGKPNAKVLCAHGSCWRRIAGSVTLQKLVSPYSYDANWGDELIVLDVGSRLEVSFIGTPQRLVLADLAAVTLREELLDGTDLDKPAADASWSGEWIPDSIDGFATKAPPKPPSSPVEKKPEAPPPPEVKKVEAPPVPDKSKEGGAKAAEQLAAPEVKLMSMGALNFEMRSPMNMQAYLSLRLPMKVDFQLFHATKTEKISDPKDLPESLRIQKWTLVKIESGSRVVPIRSFAPERFEVPLGISFGTDLLIEEIGDYGLVPTTLNLPSEADIPVRFTVYDRNEFKARLEKKLKNLKKDTVQRLLVEP